MKKFLAICIFLFLAVVFSFNFIKEKYLKSLDVSYLAMAIDKNILINRNGTFEKLYLKGVNINNVLPGTFHGDIGALEEDYMRWFEYIHDMNANVLRVQTLMPNKFYKALDKFNKGKENPLYIIQGIEFDVVGLEDGYDIQKEEIEEKLLYDMKNTVNAVHGNPFKNMPEDLGAIYNTDVSEYLLAYTIGVEFESKDIIYSHIMNDDESYIGEYIQTEKDASSIEGYLARMSDNLVTYEVEEYRIQRPITYIATAYTMVNTISSNDDNSLENFIDEDSVKNHIDIENIKATSKYKAGIFASYNIYPSVGYLKEYVDDISGILNKLTQYHTVPVLISEYGVPSSRLVADFNTGESKGGISETEQGEMLVDINNDIASSNCAGGIIYNFQDDWNISSWNTKDKVILDRNPYWRNVQTYGQSYGLLSFDPLIDGKIYYPDNDVSEWKDVEALNDNNEASLYVKASEEYLHFYIDLKEGKVKDYKNFYIDIDITPRSGSNKCSKYNLVFENGVDFIVDINDTKNSEMLVHEYYSTNKFEGLEEEIRKRPDVIYSTKYRDSFIPITEYTSAKIYVKESDSFIEEKTYETGKLVHGNANPKSLDFNSLVDFYKGVEYVEVRLPYGILNFMDPSEGYIQDDFFETFQIKPLEISDISIGLTLVDNNGVKSRIKAGNYKLQKWNEPTYHERLKKSYYIIRDDFKKR